MQSGSIGTSHLTDVGMSLDESSVRAKRREELLAGVLGQHALTSMLSINSKTQRLDIARISAVSADW